MKRTFLVKRNAVFSPANFSWGSVALAVAVLLLLIRLMMPNLFWYAFTPVFRASDTLVQMTHYFLSSFNTAATLTLQNEKLQNTNNALSIENESLHQKLQSVSGLVTEIGGITAGVVARPPQSPYDTLVLAAGSEEGVTLGQEVFGEREVPLGVITSISTHFSRATLFSSPSMAFNGWVGSKNLPLLIKGGGAGTLSASAPRAAGIVVEDTVSLPGPGSISMGRVVRVDSDPASPAVTLRILPALNLFSVTWVTLRSTGVGLLAGLSSSTLLLP